MPLHVERIAWMPSPPLAPDDGPIDTAHLQRMTLGDAGLEREVLAMFAAQAQHLAGALAGLPADAAALARRGDPSEALADLNDAVAQASSAVDAILRRS